MITIIDDVLPLETQNDIEEKLIFSEWSLARATAYKYNPEVSEQQKRNILGLTRPILLGDQVLDTNVNLYCEPLIAASQKLNFQIEAVFNIRAQLQMPIPYDGYGTVHVDRHLDRPYKVCLYYVNDTDGDTVLFKQTDKNTTPEQIRNQEFEVAERVSPKKGRLVMFDGDIYHTGSRPTTDMRFVINYNLFIK